MDLKDGAGGARIAARAGLTGDDEADRAQPALIAAMSGAMPTIVITRFRL